MLTKKRLEILLEKCKAFESPKAVLEQYTIPSKAAAEILYLAYMKGDIKDKRIYDLGCGTGRLAIGCALLGAKEITGVDIDEEALKIASHNSANLGVNVKWVKSNVKDIKGECDTVFQNPPFGVKRRGADRVFLEKALELGMITYSMHKAETSGFLKEYIRDIGGEITEAMKLEFELPYTYAFHRKKLKKINVIVLRIRRK
jgi:putative methylase